jgi:hypothetical protein
VGSRASWSPRRIASGGRNANKHPFRMATAAPERASRATMKWLAGQGQIVPAAMLRVREAVGGSLGRSVRCRLSHSTIRARRRQGLRSVGGSHSGPRGCRSAWGGLALHARDRDHRLWTACNWVRSYFRKLGAPKGEVWDGGDGGRGLTRRSANARPPSVDQAAAFVARVAWWCLS